jgi:GT2 family glycosyltransferase
MSATQASDATVVICAFAWERFDRTVAAVESALSQEPGPAEVIVVVDHNPALLAALRARLPGRVRVIPTAGPQGLAASWNTGAGSSTAAVIAFLDDDAVAEPGWLAALVRPFEDPAVLATGGVAEPVWTGTRPRWLGDEWLWVVGCTYAGMARVGAVRNVFGCNMAFRADVLSELGGFRLGMGRLGHLPLGGGETELCIRARQRWPGRPLLAVEDAVVQHHVTRVRQTSRYFVRRCFYEGVSKALLRRVIGRDALETERAYVRSTLLRAAQRDIGELLARRSPDAVARLLATAAGLAAACAGFTAGSLATAVNDVTSTRRVRRDQPA